MKGHVPLRFQPLSDLTNHMVNMRCVSSKARGVPVKTISRMHLSLVGVLLCFWHKGFALSHFLGMSLVLYHLCHVIRI